MAQLLKLLTDVELREDITPKASSVATFPVKLNGATNDISTTKIELERDNRTNYLCDEEASVSKVNPTGFYD